MPSSSDTVSEARAALPADVALHARPAADFVREAARLPVSVTVTVNGRSANARSILEVLALGATGGTELVLSASGDEAADAVARLAAVVAELR